MEHFKAGLETNPDSFQTHDLLARAYSKQGNSEKAIEHFNEALRIQPDNSILHFDMSQFLARQEQYELAIEHLNEVIKIAPDMADAYQRLGSIYRRLGKQELIVSNWNHFLKLEPESPEILNDLAWLFATSKDKNIRNPSQALKYAEKACKLTNYKHPITLDTLAVAYAATGNFQMATQVAQKALEEAATKNVELIDQIQKRIELYRAGKPFIE